MRGRRILMAAALLAALLAPQAAQAREWRWIWDKSKDCPTPSYSRVNYWAPLAVRVRAHFQGSHLNPDAQVPPGPAVILSYPCQAVDPGILVGERSILP